MLPGEPIGACFEKPQLRVEALSRRFGLGRPRQGALPVAPCRFEPAEPQADRAVNEHAATEHGPVAGVWFQPLDEIGDARQVVLEDGEVRVEARPTAGPPIAASVARAPRFPGARRVARSTSPQVGRDHGVVDHPVRVPHVAERG